MSTTIHFVTSLSYLQYNDTLTNLKFHANVTERN